MKIKEIVDWDNPILKRECRMECLRCGASMVDEIANRKVRMHFCQACRVEIAGMLVSNPYQVKITRKKQDRARAC